MVTKNALRPNFQMPKGGTTSPDTHQALGTPLTDEELQSGVAAFPWIGQ